MSATWRARWQEIRAWMEGRVCPGAPERPGVDAVRQRAAAILYARNRLEAEAARLRRQVERLDGDDPRRARLERERGLVEAEAQRLRARGEEAKAQLLERLEALRSLDRHRLLLRAAATIDEEGVTDLDVRAAEMQLDRELGVTPVGDGRSR